ncbi:MAG: aldo/keto reductase [Alphaproteobacteria bacterium]|nr:aldo/keto reductase [Alphaproteobacteria bacterium]
MTGEQIIIDSHGAKIPALGLGTWTLKGESCVAMVEHAIKVGYRHIDTAQMYDNEAAVGEGLRGSGVPRDDIFVTTKVWWDRAREGDLERSVEESLGRLGFDPVDLLLIHWPNPEVPVKETMRALNRVKRDGMARHIGISNYTTDLMAQALAHSEEPLVANQVEYHPYLDQSAVLGKVREAGMVMTSYCPIAKGAVFDDPVIREIGEGHEKTPGQVTLRWLVQQDRVAAIPRSSKPENVTANLQIFDFELSAEEMAAISALAKPDGRLVAPDFSPEWD